MLVVAVGPGWGLAVDAASFAASALVLATVAVAAPLPAVSRRVLADLRDGWRAFRSIGWLWRGVLTMSLWNAAWGAYMVLGPVVAEKAAVWAAISTAFGVGAVAGGLLLVRLRPRRPGVLFSAGLALGSGPALALAAGLPVSVAVAVSAVAGAGLVGFERHLAERSSSARCRASRSRAVTAYDLFGSFALGPVGFVLGGLLAEPLGPTTALLGAGLALAALSGILWSFPSVRSL